MGISKRYMLNDLSLNTHVPTAVLRICHPVWNCWKLLEAFKAQIKWTNKEKSWKKLYKKIQKELSVYFFSFFKMSFKRHLLANKCVAFFSWAQTGAMVACAKPRRFKHLQTSQLCNISQAKKPSWAWTMTLTSQTTSEIAFPKQRARTLPL